MCTAGPSMQSPFFDFMSNLNETLADPSHPISAFLSQNGLKLTKTGKSDTEADFEPTVDVFDIESSFVVHVSLPGAVKEDIGLHFDATNQELEISGVVYRPGDEEFYKKLVVTERQVGLFNRKVKFGKGANGLVVDVDDITAKLDAGILVVTIPKREKDAPERRKVQIE
ncbi:HSP20-like chaperone [Ascobolus immersus RN42]|uniref:HSP20-like chaperone n=1 Tax=Ascobolus immersus RN42 TaxID=1160509 RepID=A0A3N4HRY2_ASCIM|nr:HSP20-like chaperone [Ascobolus immersus RN42]